jgi:methionine sulfoxide reductase heme-binding subunit
MDEAFWALGRGTGVVALLLLTAAVLLGVGTRSGRPLFGLPRFSVTIVHRNVAILASVFTLIHVVTLFVDPYAQLTALDAIIPFHGAVDPFWLGLGTVSVDLLIAVMLTGLLRRWVGVRVFRFVHWFVYAMWPVAFIHSVGMGSDRGRAWFLTLAVLSAASVLAAVIWRLAIVEFRRVRIGASS